MSSNKILQILLVEDDDIDAEAVKRALMKQRIANPIVVARDGVAALERLRGQDGSEPLQRPFLILLDLNLPRMNGIEFLRELRSDPELQGSIVFVLTTSDADRDKVAAYEQHIAGYIVKSQAGEEFVNVMGIVDLYWRYVEFPPSPFESKSP
ncbi:response regulator [Rubripirellula reticaptiva]|uniref:Response regulator rcp1 n=1 Tax=Rubripirellula reticaptiva TaxID=2528013 RepID=A0A5C6EUC3_9BACT|nr:response regulator [Rubripirellula reticaptiva]TWU51994.1 Response regulator rcp1 [Rubripirellula reticaptiva]